MKRLLFALFFVLLPYFVCAQDWSTLPTHTKHAIFSLESSAGKCSVVLIANEIVLTAGHCIPDKDQYPSLSVDEKHAEVLKLNTTLDLAVLGVSDLHGTPIALRKEELLPGVPVSVVGFGFAADQLKYGFGWVSDPRDKSLKVVGDRLYFAVVGEVPGHSGGALLDGAGKLVAVVQGVIAAGPSAMGYGSPAAVIEKFAKAYWPKS